ncbi:hypothetical protein [Marininema halotolerans]|uniref:PrcB C-terminal n=1 Tax=Marininema halotolerans TaxID=1155944 RepID=A0A1I6RJA2_9BACL|nr:hypothetical protein [Marininema halotolerans]SFS64787.1 hypothetical protein SAMN05444972_105132 [Marininema halotolerans]
MIRRCKLFIPLLAFALLFSGCGFESSDGATASNEESSSSKNTNKNFEVQYEFNNWDTPWKSEAGVWYFTKEDHPGNLEDYEDFEDEDVLLIQVGNKEYQGYELEPVSVQLVDAETAKVVVDLDKGRDSEDHSPPRTFLQVDRGVLKYKKFLIESEDGKQLTTN